MNGLVNNPARLHAQSPLSRTSVRHITYGTATLAVFLFFVLAFGRQNMDGVRAASSWDVAVETGNTMIALVGPMVAGKAAWDLSALRKGQVFQYPNAHSHWRVIGRELLPTMVWGMACMAIMQGLCTRYARDSFRVADAIVLLTAALMVVGLTLFGAVCGMVLPRLWATAVTVVVVFFGLLFPSAVQPMWIRHLNGYEDALGVPNTMLSVRAVCAPVLTYTALAVLCIAVLEVAAQRAMGRMGAVARRLVPSFTASMALMAAAVALVLPFGAAPVSARDTSTVCERSGSTKVCVWPEHEWYLPNVVDDVRAFNASLSAAGIAVPGLVSERIPDKAMMTISVKDLSGADEAGRRRMLLDAYTDFAPTEIDGCGITETLPAYQWAVGALDKRLSAVEEGTGPAFAPQDAARISRAISDARAECRA